MEALIEKHFRLRVFSVFFQKRAQICGFFYEKQVNRFQIYYRTYNCDFIKNAFPNRLFIYFIFFNFTHPPRFECPQTGVGIEIGRHAIRDKEPVPDVGCKIPSGQSKGRGDQERSTKSVLRSATSVRVAVEQPSQEAEAKQTVQRRALSRRREMVSLTKLLGYLFLILTNVL